MDPIEAFAAALLDARRTRTPVSAAAADAFAAPLDTAAAYRVQARTVAALGAVGAWKCSPRTDGVPGVAAPIFAADIHASGARLRADALFNCGVELELAFRIDRPLPEPGAAGFADAVRAAVTPLVVFEVIDSRMAAFTDRPALAKLADMQVNGALVIGPAAADGWPDLKAPRATLDLGGETVFDGPQDVPGGDAFATLVDFATDLGGHCGGLQVGHVVTTGAIGGMRLVPPGTHAVGRIAGLGTVEMTFG